MVKYISEDCQVEYDRTGVFIGCNRSMNDGLDSPTRLISREEIQALIAVLQEIERSPYARRLSQRNATS